MDKLKNFANSIENFSILPKATQIAYFGYFCQVKNKKSGFKPKDISFCFDSLDLPQYSNLPQYLSKQKKKYYKKNDLYFLSPHLIQEIEADLSIPKAITPSGLLIDTKIFAKSRRYISEIIKQAAICYDYQCYDACGVLLRRLIETLIIECYERKGIAHLIQVNGSSDFVGLEKLITSISTEKTFNLSRNSRASLPKFKLVGDLSAHNRRLLTKKSDIDNIKTDLRITAEELLAIIDYPTWR